MLHYALEVSELDKVFKKRIVIDGIPMMFVWLADQAYAIQDHCTHLGASLSKGVILENTVTCRLHGAVFDLKTGDVIQKPHIGPLKMPAKQAKTFQTIVKEGKIYIDM